MSESELSNLRKKLDATVLQLTEMIKMDMYQNVIVATVQDWFEGNASIRELNDSIRTNVQDRWSFMEMKVRAKLAEFEEVTKTSLEASPAFATTELDVKAIAEGVSQGISVALGALGSAILGMICGGAGTALIATGPVGWIIGAIIGTVGFFLGKTKIEEVLSGFLADKKIPALIKKPAKAKVAAQMKLNEARFEQDVHSMLLQQLQPVYAVLQS